MPSQAKKLLSFLMLLVAILTAAGIALKTLILLQHYNPATQLVDPTLYMPVLNILSLSVLGFFMLGAIYIGLKNHELLPAKDGRKTVLVNALSGFFLFSTVVLQILYIVMSLPLDRFTGIPHYLALAMALPASLYFLYPIFRENYNRSARAFFGIALMFWFVLNLISLNMNIEIHLRGLTRDWTIFALVALMVYFLCELKVEIKDKPMKTQFFAGFCAVFFTMVSAVPRIGLAFVGRQELGIETIYSSVLVAMGIYVLIALIQMRSRLQEIEEDEETEATDENLPADWQKITFIPAPEKVAVLDEPVAISETPVEIFSQDEFDYKVNEVELPSEIAATEDIDFVPLDFTLLEFDVPSEEKVTPVAEQVADFEKSEPDFVPLDFTLLEFDVPQEEVSLDIEKTAEPIIEEEPVHDFVPLDFTLLEFDVPKEDVDPVVEEIVPVEPGPIAEVELAAEEVAVEEVADIAEFESVSATPTEASPFDFTLTDLEISEETSVMDYTLTDFGLPEMDFAPMPELQPEPTPEVEQVSEQAESSEPAPDVQPATDTPKVRRRPTRIPGVKKD